jgi:hypothetical protein
VTEQPESWSYSRTGGVNAEELQGGVEAGQASVEEQTVPSITFQP